MKAVGGVVPLAVPSVGALGCGDEGGGSGGSDAPEPVREIQPEAQQRAESMLLELRA